MTIIGFHASHEQMPPGELLDAVVLAEEVGFTAAMCSDHFSPWSERQGHSGFAWSWLGAALQATSLPFGVVNAPGQRYHPAIVAQAIATLASMYEGRFWAALGSGENSNEHITGDAWPRKEEREQRLRECVDVMRALFAGDTVSHDGLVTVDRARLFTRPATAPLLIGAAVSEQTAAWCAEWADGLITVGNQPERARRVLESYREAGGTGPAHLQVHLAYAADDETALEIAHDQWRSNVFASPVSWDLPEIAHFDEASKHVRPDDMHDAVLISSDPAQHAAWIGDLAAVGFDGIYLHHVGQTQQEFLEVFGAHVLPELDVSALPVLEVSRP
ncbi:MAG TPA: TIGR03885 family FMN-dependent LLM class oxidoreductase [Ilumatobacter sp.]|nr:TIGR03885 family FMN-dependent LLM class oxidoreductase [Ilumatobacter sp.]